MANDSSAVDVEVPKRLNVILTVDLAEAETAHLGITLTVVQIVARKPMRSDCTSTNASFA